MDIIILRLKYPNDPTGNLTAHQHFIGELSGDGMDVYTVSSILGKENRVFGRNKDDYEQIKAEEIRVNDFRVPSFIDCTKMYHIPLDDTVDISRLSGHQITPQLSRRIRERIARKKAEGRHTRYNISLNDFKQWNRRAVKSLR
ncbi:MAG: hypothetical protein ACI4D2_01510 [Lachnospiraceae bacterium]